MASSLTGMVFSGSSSTGDRLCKVYKGISINKAFVLKDSAGNPVDVTGWSASFVAKTRLADGTSILSITATVGTTDGLFTLVKDAATMAALDNTKTAQFAFTAIKTSGQKVLLDSGKFEVDMEIPE